MRRSDWAGILSLLLLCGPAFAGPAPLVLRHVNVVPMTGERILEDTSVLVSEGRIDAIGRAGSIQAPSGARVIDGGGRYLTPGLVEMHVHLRNEMSMNLFLGNGVTTVRNMDGTPQVLEWRDAIAAGTMRGPTLLSGSPFLHRSANDSPERYVGSVEDAVRLTRQYAAQGYDYIKIAELDDEPFFALMAEARGIGIPVVGHIPNYDLSLEKVLAQHMTSVEHIEELFRVYFQYEPDESKIAPFVEMVRRSGVPISTLIGSEGTKNGLQIEGEAYLTPERRAWVERYSGPSGMERVRDAMENLQNGTWERHPVDIPFLLRLVKELHDAGVVIVPGTDSGGSFMVAGFGLHDELDLLRQAGLTPYETLETATVNAARVLGFTGRKGTIEVGKDADLVLLARNPIEDPATLRTPVGMVLRGEWIDGAELERLRGAHWAPEEAAGR